MSKYNLAVISQISLAEDDNFSQIAYELGQSIASKNCNLLSPINLNLGYKVAQGASDRAGLSIGFSPALNYRYHVIDNQLPTDVYDWICYNHNQAGILANSLITNAQALIIVGSRSKNMQELSLALNNLMPVAILSIPADENNQALIEYVKALPTSDQQTIIIETEPQTLVELLIKSLDSLYMDLNVDRLNQNNQLFHQLFQNSN